MSIFDCIAEQVASGGMTEKGAAEYRKRMKDAESLAEQRGLAGPEAYTFAVTEAAKAMEARATSKRAQVQQTILAVDRAWDGAGKNTRGRGYGLTDVFGEHVYGAGSGSSIGQQHRGNIAALQSIMSEFLAKVQSKAFGLKQNQVLPKHLVSELYGKATSSADAAPAAKAWNEAVTWWRYEMQNAGVFVKELADWRLPQHWDSGAVQHLGKDGFVGQMEDWWKSGKLALRDFEADGQAYLVPGRADDRAREIFERAYDNITTGGDASIEPGALKHSTMGDRYGRRRAFEWTTDQAWLEFNDKLGVGNDAIGELLVRHMDKMARDLSIAQVLGPDPDRAAQVLIQMYRKETGSRFWANKLEAIYEIQTGRSNTPVSQRLAMGAQAFRQFLGTAQLGSAILSSASDFGFTKATASWHGLDMTRIMSDYLANLKPKDPAHQAQAMRDGLILEVGLRGLHDAARDTINDVVARQGVGGKVDAALNGVSRVTGRSIEFVIRAQGLAHHTQALRDAIGSQLMAHLHDIAGNAFERLDAIDKRTLTTYGIDAKEWDLLRTKGLNQGFMDAAKLAREGSAAERRAAVKMLGAIAGIQRTAVPEGNAVTRAMVIGKTQPGTWEGEALRGLAQYKGFPMASFLMHAYRAAESLQNAEGQWFRGQYLASLIVMTTVMGAASLQLKNIAAGKDPEPMYGDLKRTSRFWVNAFAQGGAGGIFADQLKAMFSAQRLGDTGRFMTPGGGFALDLAELSMGKINADVNDRQSHAGRNAIRFLNKYTPDLWYTRLAMDRIVWDTLQKMVDPESADAFSRIQERARKEQQTQYWWRPGSSSPRAPDLSRATP